METTKLNHSSQIRFWALLGPLLMLLIFTLYLVKFSPKELFLPLSAVTGLLFCWQWKTRALPYVLLALTLLTAWQFMSVPAQERFWVVGIGLSMALASLVTALSFDEVEDLGQEAEEEYGHLRQQVVELNEQLRSLKEQGEESSANHAAEMAWMKEVIQEKDLDKRKVVEVNEQLHEKIESARIQEEELRNEIKKREKSIELGREEQLQNQSQLELLKQGLKRALEQINEKTELSTKTEQKWKLAQTELQEELSSLKERQALRDQEIEVLKSSYANEVQKYQENATVYQNALSVLKEKISTLEETPLPESMDAVSRQLREQFEEKKDLLAATRRQLFQVEERLAALLKEQEEEKIYGQNPLLKTVVCQSAELEKVEKRYEEEILSLQDLISTLIRN